jgi:hypothetical protein
MSGGMEAGSSVSPEEIKEERLPDSNIYIYILGSLLSWKF